VTRRLEHEAGEARSFYRSLPAGARVGMEATFPALWFERMLAEFAASLRKGAHIHVTGYLRSREVEKPVDGKSKKSSATVKVQVWEVRAIRIAKLDRAVEVNPSTDLPANDPAL